MIPFNITNRQEYTAAGANAWTVPAGCKRVWVTLVGAGGGGGGASSSQGTAGFAGDIIYRRPFVIPAGVTSITVTLGTGGAGGTTGGTAGGDGGESTFGGYFGARGGIGGTGSAASNLNFAYNVPGPPVANFVDYLVIGGGLADSAVAYANSPFHAPVTRRSSAGASAAGANGGGGGAGAYSAAAAPCGGNAWGPGGVGGYGSAVAMAGGAGGNGYAMIEW